MDNSIKIQKRNSQYVQQFNRAVLDYEMFIFEERQQKKIENIIDQKRVRHGNGKS